MNIYTGPAASATETSTDSSAPQAQSWRDTLPIHPATTLFPRMSSDELRELGKDIRKNGLRSSLALWQPAKGASALLLDGINRLDAIEVELGRSVRVVPHTDRSPTWWSLETDEDGEAVPVTNLIGEAGTPPLRSRPSSSLVQTSIPGHMSSRQICIDAILPPSRSAT